MAEEWAWERNDGFDEHGYEQRTACLGLADCPVCGKTIELVAETECWTEDDKTGRKLHRGYGPAMGVCCGKLVADWWEGTHCFDLGGEGG